MMRYKIGAHQPNFLPYLGFFDKLKKVDILVIRDEVSFTKADFHHRNKIRINSNGSEILKSDWVGVPVENTNFYLKDVLIKDVNRGKKHWKDDLCHRLKINYEKTPYFNKHFPQFREIIQTVDPYLVDFNFKLIEYMAQSFKINTPMIRASTLGLRNTLRDAKGNPTQDLIDICKKLEAQIYLSGNGAVKYLDCDLFETAGIELEFQDFIHPNYIQNYPGFLPNMSAIDALFCTDAFPQ